MSKIPKNKKKQLILKEKNFISSTDLGNFNEIFRKDVAYDNIKNHKKAELHPLSRKHIFGKTPRRGGGLK